MSTLPTGSWFGMLWFRISNATCFVSGRYEINNRGHIKVRLILAPSAGCSRVGFHLHSSSLWLGQHLRRLTPQSDAVSGLTVCSKSSTWQINSKDSQSIEERTCEGWRAELLSQGICCVVFIPNTRSHTLPQILVECAVHTQAVFTPASPSHPVQQFNAVLQYCYAESSIIHKGFLLLFSHRLDKQNSVLKRLKMVIKS